MLCKLIYTMPTKRRQRRQKTGLRVSLPPNKQVVISQARIARVRNQVYVVIVQETGKKIVAEKVRV